MRAPLSGRLVTLSDRDVFANHVLVGELAVLVGLDTDFDYDLAVDVLGGITERTAFQAGDTFANALQAFRDIVGGELLGGSDADLVPDERASRDGATCGGWSGGVSLQADLEDVAGLGLVRNDLHLGDGRFDDGLVLDQREGIVNGGQVEGEDVDFGHSSVS